MSDCLCTDPAYACIKCQERENAHAERANSLLATEARLRFRIKELETALKEVLEANEVPMNWHLKREWTALKRAQDTLKR